MIYRYSHNYYPAAPVMEVVFISPAEGLRTERLTAVVDTGADGTLVPLQHLDDIRAPTTVEMLARSQWGESRRVTLYLVDLQIDGLTLPDMEVVGDAWGAEVVLGRDVLNRLRIQLDGPQESVEVAD